MGLPSSWPIRLIPRHGLRPRQSRPALPDGEESIACGFMNSIGIWDDRCFGAQSLHLRCGSVTRSRWLHSFGYPHYAAFTIEAAASLPQAGLSPTGYSRLFSAHSSYLPSVIGLRRQCTIDAGQACCRGDRPWPRATHMTRLPDECCGDCRESESSWFLVPGC